MSDLSIVIVSWNAKEVRLDCLESIQREVHSRTDPGRIRTETLVVDNGSGDGSVAAVRERDPWAEVIALPENLGFCAASNVGLRRAKGRHAVLLNNDTIVPGGSLPRLTEALQGDDRAWAATPRICYAGDPARAWYDGGVIGSWSGWIRHDGIRRLTGRLNPSARYVDYGMGHLMLVLSFSKLGRHLSGRLNRLGQRAQGHRALSLTKELQRKRQNLPR